MTPLSSADYAALAKSYLTREIIDAARIQRVDTVEGGAIAGRKPSTAHDYAGLIFPYFWPGESRPREYRLRRDHPDLERKLDGSIKEKNKYLSPPGRGNLLYIPADTPIEWLTDSSIPITIVEGEKKALALFRFYRDRGEKRLVIGLPGVWNFRGVVGKTTNGKGKRQDVHGVISDFDRVEWRGREVLIIFDVNVLTDETVAAARRELAREATNRGASASCLNLPTGLRGVNGVDDLLEQQGADFLAGLLATVTTGAEIWESPSPFDEYDLPAFPLDALPDCLRSFVKGLAVATQTPVDLAAMLSLANCASAIAGKVIVRVREDWTEPTNIYNVNALDVGNRKTAVHDAAKAPLEDIEAQLVRDAQPKINEVKIERDMLAARLEHLKKTAGKADNADKRKKLTEEAKGIAGDLQDKTLPAVPKLIASGDITPEAIASNLADQGGRLFVSSDEGELFQLLAGRYGNGANFEIILKAHTGGKVRVDRRGRSEIIERATLTIGMTVQPDVLRGIAENPAFRSRGLTARFLYTLPASLVGRRNSRPEPLSVEAQNTYAQRVKKLAALDHAQNAGGEPVAKIVSLTSDARDYLTAFMEEIEPQLAEGGALRPIADWANKLAGAVVRLAAILHYAGHERPHEISEIPARAIKDAITIGRYLIPHAQAAYAEMGADPEIEDARKLLRWIESEKGAADSQFSKRDAHRANHRAFPKVTDLDPALKLIEAHGYIRPLESKRRDSQNFEINPGIWSSQKPKINMSKIGDSGDTSTEANKSELTDNSVIVTTVTDFGDSDFSRDDTASGHHPVEIQKVTRKVSASSRKRVVV